MLRKMVINRYLDTDKFERVSKDFPRLVRLINGLGGEYSLQLRENYFDIYYQGNAIAKVTPNTNVSYSVNIHRKFVEGTILKKLEKYSVNRTSQGGSSNGKYVKFTIQPRNIHQFFQKNHLRAISSNIRKVNYGE
jgi:hypothetical protein